MRMPWPRRCTLAFLALVVTAGSALAADPQYPFVGSWARSDRACSASGVRERTYSAREVVSPRGRCTIRRVAHGSGGFELFERCDRPGERPYNISEVIRMTGPDAMVLTRQTARLKLSRSLRFARCQAAPPAVPAKSPAAPPKPH